MLAFNAAGFVLLYGLQRLQAFLPLDPQGFAAVPPDLAFNTAVSFVTNTNWQAYAGEQTMGHLVQMASLTVQNFVSAATGIALAVAVTRAFARGGAHTAAAATVGNFWVDLTRATLHVTPWFNTTLAFAMLLGRFAYVVPVMAIAGSLAAKRRAPASAGTFPTHGGLFVGLLVAVILIVGGLSYFPALALGPIVEHFGMLAGKTF